jgi:hypothetical protein
VTWLGKRGYCTAVPGWHWGGGWVELRFLSIPHVTSSSHFQIFPFFSPPNAGRPGHAIQKPSPARFARSGRLFFLVCCPAHLSHSVCLPVLHDFPSCPMLFNPSLLFFCPPSPTNPYFRVSFWWIAFLFLCHQPTWGLRSNPSILSPISFSTIPPRESVSFPRPSFLLSHFLVFLTPFCHYPLPIWAHCP